MAYQVQQTDVLAKWLASVRDMRARIAVARRIEQVAAGSLGDVKTLGGAISELRVDVGQGYRMYFAMREQVVVILLCGGNKRTQQADIKRARALAKEV